MGKHTDFLQYLSQSIPSGVGLSYIKQLLPLIPGDVLVALGIVRIVQKPLQAVITVPVRTSRELAYVCSAPDGTLLKRSTEWPLKCCGSNGGLCRDTVQGLVFHYTISTGTSEAEATNFHIDLPGRQFVAIWREWCQYAKRCAEVSSSSCTYIHMQVAERLQACSMPGARGKL